jgi:leukotriene-A4 hydrolase
MSANSTNTLHLANEGKKVYSFSNTIRMPNYLIALAVGDLEYRSLGNRVGVITEPEQMDAVAWELESLEELLDKAEGYLTNYIWGNYSILILPPSFPFGGMENPLLTFASPTIIAGDRSQVYVATHEIAHSWTGNDVTCKNWEHFWLNEGFTVFEERKVSAMIHGEEFAKVEALLGNYSMFTDMQNYGLNNVYSSLHPTLKGDNPDNAFSTVPYEKGFQLLTYLESFIGEELFQTFLRGYIIEYSQDSVFSEDFRSSWEDFVEDHFNATETNRILGSINWDAWLFTPGLPPVTLDFSTPASIGASHLADEYIRLAGEASPDNYTQFNDYYSNLKVIFLERLNERIDDVTIEIMQKIQDDYNLTGTVDPECKQRWLPLGIRKGYQPTIEPAHTFISVQGRIKYLSPIYLALKETG